MVKVCGFENDVKVLLGNMTNSEQVVLNTVMSLLNLGYAYDPLIAETFYMVEMRGNTL